MSVSSETVVEERTDLRVETSNDKPECAHYVLAPTDNETNHDYVMRARIEGFPVTALCGFTWVPQRSAVNLPVCAECKDIFDSCPDDGGGLPRE